MLKGGCVLRTDPVPAGEVHPKLRRLLEDDELDWDDLRQRDMFLRAWASGSIPRFYEFYENARERLSA